MKAAAGLASIVLALFASTALAAPVKLTDAQLNLVVAGDDFLVINKVSDPPLGAPTIDPLLKNPWGLSSAPGGPLWVSDNHTGYSTLYNGLFAKIPLNVVIPAADGGQGSPTGTVFTSLGASNNFRIQEGDKSGHSIFLFDTEDGTISGWAPSVDLTHAIIAVDQSAEGSSFKGLAYSSYGNAPQLFAADFANNRVEVFNNQFHQTGSFTDTTLPEGYAPFNVQTLNGKIYVAFALRGEDGDEVAGAGLGYVDVFNPQGHLMQRLVSGGALNAPWGMTIAPASFGEFAGALLVGNFGDGKINAYNPTTGAFIGTLTTPVDTDISIDGLWALRQGSDGVVIFSAGPNDEANGLIGVIKPSWAAASWAFQAHATIGPTTGH